MVSIYKPAPFVFFIVYCLWAQSGLNGGICLRMVFLGMTLVRSQPMSKYTRVYQIQAGLYERWLLLEQHSVRRCCNAGLTDKEQLRIQLEATKTGLKSARDDLEDTDDCGSR